MNMDTTLASVMKNIADALQLDSNNKLEDAYVKYTECVFHIMSTLIKDVKSKDGKVLITKEVMKYVQLGSQCMERILIVVNTISKTTVMSDQKSAPGTATTPIYRPPTSPASELDTNKPGFRFSAPVPPIQDSPDRTMYQRTKSLGPLDLAYKRNQLLMAAYKARQAKLNARNAFDLSLTLQRKMAENLAIAKLQEEALSKKMKERQQRLDDLANQKFGSTNKETKEMYKQVLNYEQDAEWLQNMRKELEENPSDPSVISKVMQAVLCCKDHPLTEKLKAYQYKIYERIYPLVSDKMEESKKITVPLDKSLWPSIPKVKDKLAEEKWDENSDDHPVEDKGIMEAGEVTLREDKSEISLSELSSEKSKSLEEISADVKEDLEKAMDMGDKLQHKLEESNEKTLKMAQRVSLDVESYHAENMDDLFDDEDEEKEDDEDDEKSIGNQDVTVPKERAGSSEELELSGRALRSDSSQSLEDPEQINRLKMEAYKRHLKGISEDVHCYLDKLQEMFICAYEQFGSPEGRDCCYSQLEEPFFKPIWQYLLALYRFGNKSLEIQLAHVMTVHMNGSPADLGVKAKLRLQSHDQNMNDIPYKPAIEELRSISSQVTLLGKLESLVKSSRLICRCVEEHYNTIGENAPAIGADDLLPILSYVIVRTGLPQIVSECSILEEFIHEGYIMGEEGYCLTSVQTALKYLETLSNNLLASDEE